MPPTFINVDRRLVMRYGSGGAFSFSKVRVNSSDEGLLDLANAFASIQSEQPTKVTTVLTSRLFNPMQ